MKNIFKHIFVMISLISVFSCKSVEQQDSSANTKQEESHQSSMNAMTQNRSFGQIIRSAAKFYDHSHFIIGHVVNLPHFTNEHGMENFVIQIKTDSEIMLNENQVKFPLGSLFYIYGLYGSDGEKLKVGETCAVLINNFSMGHAKDPETDIEYEFYSQLFVAPFAKNSNELFVIAGEDSSLRLVEKTLLNEASLRLVVHNAMNSQATIYNDACPDTLCENRCRTRDTDVNLTIASDCSTGQGECFL